jgi:hypothetical protein
MKEVEEEEEEVPLCPPSTVHDPPSATTTVFQHIIFEYMNTCILPIFLSLLLLYFHAQRD